MDPQRTQRKGSVKKDEKVSENEKANGSGEDRDSIDAKKQKIMFRKVSSIMSSQPFMTLPISDLMMNAIKDMDSANTT